MATVLITGANRGIGLELARQAAARGDTVIATARRPGTADDLIELTRRRGSVEIIGLDVSDPDQIAGVAADLRQPIDLLVCNAGQYVARGGIEDPDYTAEAWSSTLMTNVAGPFFTVRAFLPNLAAGAKVAVISSVMGSSGRPGGAAYIYRASKAAATNLAKNLAEELRPRGVSVGAYHPGWVRTDMGGPSATLSLEESAEGLLKRFDVLGLETSGVLEDYRGAPIPL